MHLIFALSYCKSALTPCNFWSNKQCLLLVAQICCKNLSILKVFLGAMLLYVVIQVQSSVYKLEFTPGCIPRTPLIGPG